MGALERLRRGLTRLLLLFDALARGLGIERRGFRGCLFASGLKPERLSRPVVLVLSLFRRRPTEVEELDISSECRRRRLLRRSRRLKEGVALSDLVAVLAVLELLSLEPCVRRLLLLEEPERGRLERLLVELRETVFERLRERRAHVGEDALRVGELSGRLSDLRIERLDVRGRRLSRVPDFSELRRYLLRRLREDARLFPTLEKRLTHLDELLDDLTQRTRETDAESDRREVDRPRERPHRLLDLVDRVVEAPCRRLKPTDETARFTSLLARLASRLANFAELGLGLRRACYLDVDSDFPVRDHVTSASSSA